MLLVRLTVVIITCCMIVGLLLMWRKPRWFAVATSRGTQTLDEDFEHCHTNILPRNGLAVHCRQDCPVFFEDTRGQKSEVVFSLRSKRRFVKALEGGGHIGIREQVLNLGVFPTSCSTVEHLFHSCTLS